LQQKNELLSRQLIQLERDNELAKQACQLVQADLGQNRTKITALEKDRDFYKSLVTSYKNRESLYLQHLKVEPLKVSKEQAKKGHLYSYSFILAQTIIKKSYSKGTAHIYLVGKQEEKPVRLALNSLVLDPEASIETAKIKKTQFKYSFKYYQEFTGKIRLPENVLLSSIDVVIDAKNKKSIFKLSQLKWNADKGLNYLGD